MTTIHLHCCPYKKMISPTPFLFLSSFEVFKCYIIHLRFYLELTIYIPSLIHSVNVYGEPAPLPGTVIAHGLHVRAKNTKGSALLQLTF